jgi:hypothetical protein
VFRDQLAFDFVLYCQTRRQVYGRVDFRRFDERFAAIDRTIAIFATTAPGASPA